MIFSCFKCFSLASSLFLSGDSNGCRKEEEQKRGVCLSSVWLDLCGLCLKKVKQRPEHRNSTGNHAKNPWKTWYSQGLCSGWCQCYLRAAWTFCLKVRFTNSLSMHTEVDFSLVKHQWVRLWALSSYIHTYLLFQIRIRWCRISELKRQMKFESIYLHATGRK